MMNDVLSADMVANGWDRWRWRYLLTKPIARFLFFLRACESLRGSKAGLSRVLYLLLRLQLEVVSRQLGFSIPLGVFGPGLSIAHRGTIVVNGDARVGSGCRIHPGVTIGGHRGAAPRLGNDVFLGPNCVLIGSCSVGDSAQIGPLALVNFDVEPGATVVGPRGLILGPRT